MKKIATGALAALLASALLAPSSDAAAPANVTVRVEGATQTLLPRTAVTTRTAPVGKDGVHTCSGTSALGALDTAVTGDWAGSWTDGLGYAVLTIKGETHNDPFPADPARYWSFWVNYRFQDQGLCSTEMQQADDILMFVDCFSQTSACAPQTPLRLSGVPRTVAPGHPTTVKLEEFTTMYDSTTQVTTTTPEPAENATIKAAGQTVTTGADGTARLAFGAPGPVTIAATKAGRVRTAALTCVTSGSDGTCGSELPPNAVLGTDKPDDKTAPIASFSRLHNGQVFKRRRAPRRLKGSVTPDPSGLLSVRLGILRKVAGRCSAFDGATERFRPHRCGGRRSFRIGDRADWSYLLPKRLGKGRYTIRVAAIDQRGNDSATQVVIRVR
jgi:hypothetical protein